MITGCLIFLTAVSVCFLFWFQNFTSVSEPGTEYHQYHHKPGTSLAGD